MKKIFKSSLAIIRNGKMLYTKEFGTDKYFSPGGKIEKGETPEQALKRELKEEVGIEVDTSTLKRINTFEDRATLEPNTLINITLFTGDFFGNLKPSGEIKKLKWFGKNDDWNELGFIDRNKIMPYLVEKGLVK